MSPRSPKPDPDALQVAVRELRHRDLSAAAVDERLERAGVPAAEREAALETLARVGYVSDERVASQRARLLAERGWGDRGIAVDLEQRGLDAEVAAAAIAALEPERERAAQIVAQRGPGAKTAGYLARRGFGEDAVEQALVAKGAWQE